MPCRIKSLGNRRRFERLVISRSTDYSVLTKERTELASDERHSCSHRPTNVVTRFVTTKSGPESFVRQQKCWHKRTFDGETVTLTRFSTILTESVKSDENVVKWHFSTSKRRILVRKCASETCPKPVFKPFCMVDPQFEGAKPGFVSLRSGFGVKPPKKGVLTPF